MQASKVLGHGRLSLRWAVLVMGLMGIFAFSNCGGTSVQTPAVTATITPANVTVGTAGVQVFFASFGVSTWSVNGVVGGNATVGTINSVGAYVAPATPPTPNAVTITAQSVANSKQTVSATATIVNRSPILNSLTPAALAAGSGDSTVSLLGSNFYPVSTVTLNGTQLATTFVSAVQLSVTVPAAMLANPGVSSLIVSNPSPGGGTVAPLNLTVVSTGLVTNTNNVLVAQYSISSPRDASMVVEFGPDTNYGLHTWVQQAPVGGGQVNMLVAGMRVSSTYHMRAILSFPDGTQYVDSDKTFATGAPGFPAPNIVTTNPNGLMPTPGVVLFHLTPNATHSLTTAAYDMQGNLVWYYDPGVQNFTSQPAELLPNGHMLINMGPPVREVDLAGNTIRQFAPSDVTQWLANAGYNMNISTLHHDLLVLPNGHYILLANTIKTFTGLPGTTGNVNVEGDVLVDLDQNSNVVWVWSTFDHLDINRHPSNYPDWTHSNAIIYSADDGNLVLSSRSQSWIMKIDYQDGRGTGDILWRFGYQGDFQISSGVVSDWMYSQHFPIIVSPNTTGVFEMAVFDNGDERFLDNSGTFCGLQGILGPQAPGTIPCYTRGVTFQVDEIGKTGTVLWQDNINPIYSFWGGSIQRLDNGNMAIDFNTPTDNITGARYVEVTPDATPQVVLQMEVSHQNAYRAIHMPSLYPGVQW